LLIGIVWIMSLPDLVDYDTLMMAPALAVRGGARPVVDELLAAANNPDRLLGIDPTLIRVRAADLLSLQHDPALLDDAVAILREAVAQALPDEQSMAQDALVKTLAEQGDRAELDAIARDLLRQPPGLAWAQQLEGMSSIATIFGYGREAAAWLDEALATPADRMTGPTLAGAKERMVKLRATMTADGFDPDDPAAAQERMRTLPKAAATVSSYPPWPSGVEGRLLWWPEPDYARVTRQLPELATVLGGPWRGHTGRVQAAMTGRASQADGTDRAVGRAAQPHSLVAADFTQFAQFLEWSRADPLASSTMTAFGALATKLPNPVRWPPKDRAPCWCGSGARYRDCCARRGGAD
jgi:SEC-C motif